MERGDFLVIDLTTRDLDREASECYKGYVRSRSRRVPNEVVKYNAFTREEEVRSFPHRYIKFVKSSDGHVLLSGSSDRSRPRKELYWELEVGSASEPLVERLGWSLEEIRSQ